MWLRFAHITDAQVCDEESPARAVRFDQIIPESWRPQEAYAVHVLDAVLRALNARHQETPLDFVIHTGDAVELGQYNELRWFLDTFDGRTVTPDSGSLDGPERPGPAERNPKLAFPTAGLDRPIPWYAAFGNHDVLGVGNFRIEETSGAPVERVAPLFGAVAAVMGLHAFPDQPNWLWPADDRSPAVIEGAAEPPMDGDTLQLRISELETGAIAPDTDRRFLTRREFVEAHFHTETLPAGHGFTEANRAEGHGYYSVRPRADIPVRLLVLDTVSPAPVAGWPFYYGVMSRAQFREFLKPAVHAARQAGEYVIIASHHPSEDFNIPHPGATVSTLEFRRFLAAQPNVLAHICGHTHRHRVRIIPGRYPYPEIETASLIDYPQEGRILELHWLEKQQRFRLDSFVISPGEQPAAWSEESRRRAEIDLVHRGPSLASGLSELFPAPKLLGYGPGELGPPFPLTEEGDKPGSPRGKASDREFSLLLSPRAMDSAALRSERPAADAR